MTLTLWGTEISYDEKVVSLLEFSMFLEQRAKKSASDFLSIGIQKKIGWLNPGTAFLEDEMRRVCDEISIYITNHNILAVPNWNMFLEPWVTLAENSKVLMLTLNKALIVDCTNEVREQANQAYRNSMANSEGLGFGIISSSLAAHFIYAMQAAEKEAENKRAAEIAASTVWDKSNPVARASELTIKAYHETHEPFVLDTMASFYTNVESFIYTGAGYDKKLIDEQTKSSVDMLGSTNGDIHIEIVQALSKNICCGEAVLTAIENGLVDDSFIDFCNYAPIMLLKKSVNPIVGWLAKEKRTNQLYNRPIFNGKTRHFLGVAQKVFLYGNSKNQTLYEQILDGAFADEINRTCSECFDLFHSSSVLEKYASNGTHISVSSGTVALLVTLCNEIQSSKLISLVKSTGLPLPIEVEQIKALIAEANIAIESRSVEIMKARAEAAEREVAAKAEKVRIEAERQEKQRAERAERKRTIIKRVKLAATIVTPIIVVALVFFMWLLPDVIQPSIAYSKACSLMEQGSYQDAIDAFRKINDYRDSETQIRLCESAILDGYYNEAMDLLVQGFYQDAAALFEQTAEYQYKDSDDKIKQIVTVLMERSKTSTISAGFCHVVGLRNDGTVVSAGSNSSGQCNVGSWKNIIAVSAGGYHTVGLKADGTVVATGDNEHGQCNVFGWKNIVAIYAGSYHTIGLKSDGSVVVAGIYYYYQSGELVSTHTWPQVSGWRDIYAVGAGNNFSVAIRDDHTVIAVGDNDYGQCNTATWKNVYAISISSGHTVGLKSDGTVIATGIDFRNHGQCDVGKWNSIIAIAAGSYHTVGLRVNGKVVAVGYNEYGQCDVFNWENVVAIAAGSDFTVALFEDGSVVATGNNENGQCNVSEWTDIRIPN